MPGAIVARNEEVTFRTVEEEDLGFVQRGTANPEIRIPLGSRLRSRSELEEMDDEDVEGDHFLVCLEDVGASPGQPDDVDDVTPIGKVSVSDTHYRRPDLGYWIVPEYQGEGYGRAAVSLLVDYVFDTYDHPAVGAIAYDFNHASRALLESLGFEEEGCVRRDRFIDGAYVDTYHYGLLREDWRE